MKAVQVGEGTYR